MRSLPGSTAPRACWISQMPRRRWSLVRAGVPERAITLALYCGLFDRLMFWKVVANVPLSIMTFRPAIALLNESAEPAVEPTADTMASPTAIAVAEEAGPIVIVTALPAPMLFTVPAAPIVLFTLTICAENLTGVVVPV